MPELYEIWTLLVKIYTYATTMKKQLFPEPCSNVNVNDKKFTSDMESQTWTDVHGYGVQYVTFNMDFV